MPQQTTASDFTKYKKLATDIASSKYSAKPNLQVAVLSPQTILAPVNLSTVLSTQANAVKYRFGSIPLTWHR